MNKIVRIEGQVKGIREMVEEGRECTEILTQIMAARAALESVALDLVSSYLEQCIPENDRKKLVQTLKLFLRRW